MPRLSDRAGVIGLAAFLAVDVLLVAVAVNSTRTPVPDAGKQVGSSAVGTTTSPTTSAGSATGDPAAAEVKVAPLTVGIVGIDKDTALRFTVGACPKGGAGLELTRNGGKSWGPRSAPFDALVRIRVREDKSAFAVGASSSGDCKPSIRQAGQYDADWGDSSPVNNAWYRDPRDDTRVGLPTGDTGKPCGARSVVDLAIVDRGAAALCSDGAVQVSQTGAKWDESATVGGALALALDDKSRTFAVVPSVDDCRGLAVVDAAKPDKAVGCVPADLTKVEPGTVALSVVGSTGWLRAGDTVWRASGDLSGWKKA